VQEKAKRVLNKPSLYPSTTASLVIENGKTVWGFAEKAHFGHFCHVLATELRQADYSETVPVLQGSAVTGWSFNREIGFDDKSDFDVALVSPKLMTKAASTGIEYRSGYRRTEALNDELVLALNLTGVRNALEELSGRLVNFMLFDNTDNAIDRNFKSVELLPHAAPPETPRASINLNTASHEAWPALF
jgi:hypothetical protein